VPGNLLFVTIEGAGHLSIKININKRMYGQGTSTQNCYLFI